MGQTNSSAAFRRPSLDSVEPILQNSESNNEPTNIVSRFLRRVFGGTCRKRKRADDDSTDSGAEGQRSKIIRLDASTDTILDTRDAATGTTDDGLSSKDASIQTDADGVGVSNGTVHHLEKSNGNANVRGKVDEAEEGKFVYVEGRDFMEFPFLTDRRSIQHCQVSRVMLVMRGLPGSGKSTVVKQIKKKFPDAVSCSADDFFTSSDGIYNFNEKKLKEAHTYSQARAEEACRLGHPLVIVDNTNVKRWEMAKYFSIAEQYMYMVVLVEPRTPWRFDPVQLAARTCHGVPRNLIAKRVKDYELVAPRYFGWFLNEADSLGLIQMANSLLLRCLQTSQLFMEDFKQFSGAQSFEEMLNFYSRRHFRGVGAKIIHCTAKFLRKGEGRDYFERPELGDELGKTSVIKVGGFSFSSQTFGAKIELSDQQLALWDQDDSEMPRPQAQPPGPPRSSPPTNSARLIPREEKEDFSLSSLRVSSIRIEDSYGQEEFGRRAHFTIGASGSTPPVCTGPETSRAVKLVRAAQYAHSEALGAGGGVVGGHLIRLAPDHWFLSLDRYIVANGLFTGSY